MDKIQSDKTKCFKCDNTAEFKYRPSISMCANCFGFHVIRKKFRQNLRNQVDVIGKHNEIILFIDGTLESVVALKLFAENLDQNNKLSKVKKVSKQEESHDVPKLSKNKLKKQNKKDVIKKMFITGKAVFLDFKILLSDYANFFGKFICLIDNFKMMRILSQRSC